MELLFKVLVPVITLIIGFYLGYGRFWKEQKHKAYKELLPPIIKMAYDRKRENEDDFNKAQSILWLYANKNVAIKMDTAISRIVNPDRGNVSEALKEAIVEMRKDLHKWYGRQSLKSADIKHLYSKVKGI